MKPRFRTLDALRGFAAIVVLLFHFRTQACAEATTCTQARFYDFPYAPLAVDLFFALSGFVIDYNYRNRFDEGLSPRAFMEIRLKRLLPIFWIGMLGAALLVGAKIHLGMSKLLALRILLPNLVLLPSPVTYPLGDPFSTNSPAWSLFYEVWVANLIYGLLGRRLSIGTVLGLVVIGAAGLVSFQAHYGTTQLGFMWPHFLGGLPRVVFSFFVGVAVNRLHITRPAPRVPSSLVVVIALLTFILPVPSASARSYELLCLMVIYPSLLYFGAAAKERRPELGKLLGDASYAVYVIHMPLLLLFVTLKKNSHLPLTWPVEIVFSGIVLTLATIIDTFVDKPARAALNRLLVGLGSILSKLRPLPR